MRNSTTKMAYMYLTFLVSVLTLAVVQCETPDCSSSSCSATQTCQWTCKKAGKEIGGALTASCTTLNKACGNTTVTDGQCEPTCKCGTATCSAAQSCNWTCIVGGNVISKADVSSCSALSKTCNSTGTCVAACLQKPGGQSRSTTSGPPGNGFTKHGLSSLVMMCGILAKLFLSL